MEVDNGCKCVDRDIRVRCIWKNSANEEVRYDALQCLLCGRIKPSDTEPPSIATIYIWSR